MGVLGRWFWGLGCDRSGLRSGVVGVSGRGIVSGHGGLSLGA